MLIPDRPTRVVTTRHVCDFHKRYPTESYAGCTCSGSYRVVADDKPVRGPVAPGEGGEDG